MHLSVVHPLQNGAVLRAQFFRLHGVTLASPSRSTSGLRQEDGMVVFAMCTDRVSIDPWGCSCLLWAGSSRLPSDAVSVEMLRHCRLAVQHGVAEGFLVDTHHAPIEPQELLALRVVRVRTEYWARWGNAARAERSGAKASLRGARSR